MAYKVVARDHKKLCISMYFNLSSSGIIDSDPRISSDEEVASAFHQHYNVNIVYDRWGHNTVLEFEDQAQFNWFLLKYGS